MNTALLLLLASFAAAGSAQKVHNPVSPERKAELLKDVKAKVKGIALPLLTLYKKDGAVDHDAMTKYVQQMMADGLTEGKGVILAAASGGDFPSLSIGERKNIAKTVVKATGGKVPVFLSVQESHLDDVVDLAQYAESIGCYGIQLSVPYYWTATDGDAIAWFETVHNATKKVIIAMYNTPWENYDAPLAVLKELAQLERVRVLKFFTDRAPQMFRWKQAMVALRDEFAIVDNTLSPVENHIMGGTCSITHLASVWPQHEFALMEKLEAGKYDEAMRMWEKVNMPWYEMRIEMGAYTSGEAPPVKAALELTGRVKDAGPQRLPSRALTPKQREDLRQLLLKMGVPGVHETEVQI
jgi:4-hydroxy-tetrahydrodipicolinate synthase